MRWQSRQLAKRSAAAAAVAAVIAGGIATWIAVPPRIEQDKAGTAAVIDQALIEAGKYLATVGDCVACHTEQGGTPMAGGRALETPFGTVWSTNITPDLKTGIGSWSFGAFDRAMRKGVSRDGHRLYPAMPYPSFAKIREPDMRALWAYLSKGLAPVSKANRAAEMRFPFDFRLGLAYWNALFLDTTSFVPNPAKDTQWNRGAYLVQGLGHCGACHTPRGVGFQEKAMSDAGRDGRLYVSGARVEDWDAVDLRDVWAVDDMVKLLKTGQNRFATAFGSMTAVIHHSTQHISNDDLAAIATYLKAMPSNRPKEAPLPVSKATLSTTYSSRGGLGYTQFCSDCHRPDGAGVPGIFPSLAGNPNVAAQDASGLIHIALTGWTTAASAAHPRVFTMPTFAGLDDRDIADILSFVRASWGDGAAPVAAADVAALRATLDPKFSSSRFEAPRLANLLSAPNADQLVHGMRLNTETKALLPDHVGADLNCASCHLNAGTVADATPYVGVSLLFPRYSARAGSVSTLAQRINGCFERSMNGKALATDSPEMKAMIAYFEWMKGEAKPQAHAPGSGMGEIDRSLTPDPDNGRRVYARQCAVCHGANGEGRKDAAGRGVFPPLWGDRSFNKGAGMARTEMAAAFVKHNMPIAWRQHFPLGQGGLSDQEALDVAAYFSPMPRPDFPAIVQHRPDGHMPKDGR